MNTKEGDMSFLDHLEILRWHLIRSGIAILLFSVLAFIFKEIIFDAILFYSPSGIKSYLINNSLNNSYCVCIGKTTSKYAHKYSNKVLSCDVPTIENVINKTIKLFENE